jgi:hypothetical protein
MITLRHYGHTLAKRPLSLIRPAGWAMRSWPISGADQQRVGEQAAGLDLILSTRKVVDGLTI